MCWRTLLCLALATLLAGAARGGAADARSAVQPDSAPSLPFASAPPLSPPTAIRVAHHPLNSCRDLPDWTVTVVPFEEYVARVLPAEVYTSWPAATLQAQAIAIRTFAWRKILLAPPAATYDITDWAVDQVMCDRRYASTDAAAAATAGRYLAYGDQVILAQYSAENGHPTVDGGLPYLKPVLDPVSLGRPRRGHGHGLSQWGAQRWASLHGWNTTQILAHYYTGAEIVDPLAGDPSLSLLTPWPAAWLTGSAAYLTAHASFPPTATVTVTFSAPGFRSLADFGSLPGLWAAGWPLPATLTRPVTITASAVITNADLLTQTVTLTHTLTLAGEDRLPPVLHQIALPANAPSLTVTLHISATDFGPSGLAAVASGGDWQIRPADFVRQAGGGDLITDPDALSGSALALPAGIASRWQATLTQALEVNQIYQAYARLRTTGQVTGTSQVPVTLVRLELYDLASDELLGFADLRGGDFRQPDVYQEFPIDFWLSPTASGRVSVRLSATGEAEVAFDRLRVLRGPQPFETDIPCRLQHRAGPQTVVIKALDAAGNPAVELTGATQLVDTAPPGAWQLLAPTGWVTTTIRPTVRVYVADELTGIAPDSAAGRFTTDAGLSWSTWQPISATVKPDGSAELTWVWPGGEGAGAHRAQFRVADNAELTAVSPAWPVRVDMTLPTATLSAPRRAIAGAPFTVQWAGWDNIGVASFDVQRSIENDTWQDWLSGTTATQAGYLAPAPGPVRLRVRARDLAGNTGPWSAAQTVAVVGLRFLPFVANR